MKQISVKFIIIAYILQHADYHLSLCIYNVTEIYNPWGYITLYEKTIVFEQVCVYAKQYGTNHLLDHNDTPFRL